MKTKIRPSKKSRNGSILAIAVVIMVVLSILGVGMLMLGRGARLTAARTTADMSARLAADAGFTKALFIMNDKLVTHRGALWNNVTFPISGSASLDNSYGSYSYSVEKTGTGTFIEGIKVTSTGTCGIAQRNVHTKLLPHSSWYGIGVKDSIDIKSKTEFFTINPSGGEIILQTTSTDEDSITIKNGVTIPGDVIVGVGGNVEDIIDNKGIIEGQAYASVEEVQFPPVQTPTGTILSTISGGIIPDTGADIYQYPSISLGNSEVLTITGDAVIYVPGDIVLNNGAEVLISSGASLTLYLGGNLEDKNSAGFSYDANVPNPSSLKIYGLDTCEQIDLKAKSYFAGMVYAPSADVTQKAKSDFYGAVIGNSMDLYAGSNFYLDLSLADVNDNEEGVYFSVSRWWED